jgi:MFS superfamily sulfate permease-like transporter
MVLRALNHPRITELRRKPDSEELLVAGPEDPAVPGMLILRIEGGMYTMNIRRVQDEIYARFEGADPRPQVVLIDASATVDTSITVIDIWAEIDARLAENGAALWVAELPERALKKLERTDNFGAWQSEGRIHPSVSAAVAAFTAG